MPSSIIVRKADGTEEHFAPEKLTRSLERAGAPELAAEGVVRDVEQRLQSGMTTEQIYKTAYTRLCSENRASAARYSMKRALLEFGPSGFPFEEYVAEIYRAGGARAVTNTFMQGACVEHEIDVLAEDGKTRNVIEAKFHNTLGFKSDLKVALYVGARVADLQKGAHADELPITGTLLTNTKFTSKAIQYGTCVGLALISWDYPQGGNLHQLIDRAGVFPVTALTTLSRREKFGLMEKNIVLCKAVPKNESILRGLGLKPARIKVVFDEVSALCGV